MTTASDDKAYRDLFSHPEIVRELAQEFIPKEISERLDLDTLTHHPGQYITPQNKEKIQDVVWSAQLKPDPDNPQEPPTEVYLYLLLEFQSSDDKTMPLRIAHYTVSFYSHLIKLNNINLRKEKLPLVFPCVLYNGEHRWKTPIKFSAFLPRIPKFLKKYQISQEYYLIDEKRLNNEQLKQSPSLLSSVFDTEQSEELLALENALELIRRKIQSYPQDQATRFAEFIGRWLNNYLLKSKLDITLSDIDLLEEEPMSLRKYVENLEQKYRQEGEQKGVEKGRLEGRQEGEHKGRKEGFEAGLRKAAINLHRNMQLAADQIAVALQLPVEKVEHILASEQS